MLITALKKHFQELLKTRPIVLWFDPEGDFLPLLDELHASGVPLRRIQSEGQLIRLRADQHYSLTQIVVYLPWKRDAAETDLLIPIFPLASVFNDTLFRFLSDQGVTFPEDAKTRNAIKDVLPRIAKQSIGKGEGYWKKVLSSLDAVREELLGDFENKLLNYLTFPAETHAELKKNEIENFFFGLLASRYGIEVEANEKPEAIARRLTAHFILVRAYTTNRSDNFPFLKLIPSAHLLDKCEAFLRRWQDSSFAPVFERLSNQIEPQYSLKNWITSLPLDSALCMGATFLSIENYLWERVVLETKQLKTDSEWLSFLQQHQNALDARRAAYWANNGKAPQWAIISQASSLLQSIHTFESEIDHISDVNTLIRNYTNPQGWWQIDLGYRQLRELIGDATGSYDRLHQRAGRAYHRFLELLNNRFAELLSGCQQWNLDALPAQTKIWNDEIKIRKGHRVAVIFVDALRLELAHALVERLQRDLDPNDVTIQPRLVSLPAVTDVCMPALLPDGDSRKVDHDGKEWQVTIGASGNLGIKAERIAYLRKKYPRIQVYNEISELLTIPTDQIPATAELYVTFHTALDNIGEEAHELALTVFSALLKDVERAIRKFHEAEIEEIHVITDHGFLLLDDVSEADKIAVKDVPALKKGSRYLVGRNLGHTDQLRFPIPGGENHLEGWFARGIGCFRTPGKYNYTHGGLSLQEVAIPYLKISQKSSSGLIDVELSAPEEIRGKLLKVKIKSLSDELLARPRQVELRLEKLQGSAQPIVAYQQVMEVGAESEIKVLLPESALLEIGEKVVWRLVDAISGQVLQEQVAVNKIDFF